MICVQQRRNYVGIESILTHFASHLSALLPSAASFRVRRLRRQMKPFRVPLPMQIAFTVVFEIRKNYLVEAAPNCNRFRDHDIDSELNRLAPDRFESCRLAAGKFFSPFPFYRSSQSCRLLSATADFRRNVLWQRIKA
jgi:hypothetical protein